MTLPSAPRTAGAHPPARRLAVSLLWFPALLLLAGLALPGCSLFEDDPISATLSGRVVNADGAPVVGAEVRAVFADAARGALSTTTNAEGRYSFAFSLEPNSDPVDLTVTATFEGTSTPAATLTLSEDARTARDVDLAFPKTDDGEDDGPTGPSGTIARIQIEEQSGTVLRVLESGGPESASITFVAVDSIGRPLSANNAVEMRFRLGANPGNGLDLNPPAVTTNARGQATAVLTSGTRSGVVQVVAEADRPAGGVVRSDPVRITIHGGLPAQSHFSLGPTRRNIPGLVRFNEQTQLEVIVGDKYSNPVVPGTAVYFSSSHAVIDGSTETDADGLGGVTLRSANPLPAGNGIVIVTAETIDENENRVFDQTPVLFSGPTRILLTPQTVGFGSYVLRVDDPNGNPLVAGTTVSVAAEGTGVVVSGLTNVTLDDTSLRGGPGGDGLLQPNEVTAVIGDGITTFPFSLSEDPESEETPEVTSIRITVTSPNGNVEATYLASSSTAAVLASARTDAGATIDRLPGGGLQVRAVR